MHHMTGLERSLRAIHHQQPDRVPVIPQAHVWALYHYGSSAEACMWDGELYAQIQIQAWKDFGWDGIFVATDSVALAHSLGLEVSYTEVGAAPGPIGLLNRLEDVDKLQLKDPRQTRLNEWLIATQMLLRELGDRVLILARADAGPFSLAGQLRGMEEWLLDVARAEQPELMHRLLDFCTDYILAFADLLLEAGALIVTIGDGLASSSLISPTTFRRFAFPYQQKVARAVQARGGRLSIHVCGKTEPVFDQLVATGADVLEFDAPTDFDLAWRTARGRTCLLGNVPVSEVMTLGKPDLVKAECRWRLEKVKPASGYILSSGCALSPNVPADNLYAMVESARRYGHY